MGQLRALIKGEIGREVISLGEVNSTNTFAMEIGDKGAAHGTVVIADSQTKGRGRMGRTWVSPPGRNIYMSVILRPSMQVRDATLLTIIAGVACCRALRYITHLPVDIKWPNDLMVSRRKLGGILTETKSGAGRIISAVIGIGINLNAKLEDFPSDVKAIATSVRNETGKGQSRTVLIGGILNELDYWYRIFVEKERNPILNEWRKLTSMLGKPVQVIWGGEGLNGIADDIDDEGMLILRLPSGILKKISAGDLTILQ